MKRSYGLLPDRIYIHSCAVCARRFQARKDARYCGDACRQKAHRARHRSQGG